jgi:hypothetical protein
MALWVEDLSPLSINLDKGMRYGFTRKLAIFRIIKLEYTGAGKFQLYKAELAWFDRI